MSSRLVPIALAVSLGLVGSVTPVPASAQVPDATTAQRELVARWVSLTTVRARLPETHHEVTSRRTAFESARRDLERALAAGNTPDLETVRAALRADLAELEARLSSLGATCNGSADISGALARRSALAEALTHLEGPAPWLPPGQTPSPAG